MRVAHKSFVSSLSGQCHLNLDEVPGSFLFSDASGRGET